MCFKAIHKKNCPDVGVLMLLIRFVLQNTHETAHTIKGMHLRRAVAYLKNVVNMKEIVPFRRYNGGPGRHAQVSACCCMMNGFISA